MGERTYDIVVFGATGFTGMYVVEELARTAQEEKQVKWAVAGRNKAKIQQVLRDASSNTGTDLANVPIIIADISSEEALNNMCQQTRIVLNCVGPYRHWGEPMVKACVASGTHHLDITGELGFIDKITLDYSEKAKEAGVYVVSACGYDSIPIDLGVVFTKNKFEGELNHVHTYMTMNIGSKALNTGTWNSAVHVFANFFDDLKIHKDYIKTTRRLPKPKDNKPFKFPIHYSDDVSKWGLFFPSCDKEMVRRTQTLQYETHRERPVQCENYMAVPSFIHCLGLILMAVVVTFTSLTSWGLKCLEKYPSLFSGGFVKKGGPNKEAIKSSSFNITFVGYGYPSKADDPDSVHEDEPTRKIVTAVSGPDPAYLATPICLVQSAYAILDEPEKLPQGGGVFSPGAAFGKTKLIDRLHSHGVKFDVIQS